MNQSVEIQYFGCVYFYIEAVKNLHVIFEQYESYQKMSYRNRTQVLGASGVLNLSVPLVGGRDQKKATRDVEIDYLTGWQKQHWRTLESCYNKSPFFIYYRDSLESLLFGTYKTLWELDLASVAWCLARLKIDAKISFTEKFEKHAGGVSKTSFMPQSRNKRTLEPYQQVFNLPFETDLSILDLLFNLGPQAADYLARQPLLR